MKSSILKLFMLAFLIVFAMTSRAQDDDQTKGDEKSASEIAVELAHPNTTLGTMNFNFDYINYQGDLPDAGSQNGFSMGFQPVLPIPLSKTVNLFVRPQIPLYFTQPTYGANGFENQGVNLGNISADVAVGKTFPSKTVGVIGVFGSFRTATDDALRSNYTLLGPEIAVGQIFNWGVVGLLVTHGWSVNSIDAAAGDESASITSGQYFYVVNLNDGWQIAGSPTFSYNHNAAKGNKLTFPIGIGVNKVTLFGKLPIKFSMQYWYYVASPDAFGPQHQIRFTISPVVPLPW